MGLNVFLATGFGVGELANKKYGQKGWTGAGLLGTFEGLLLFYFLPQDPLLFLATFILAAAVSCWVCDKAASAIGKKDPSSIILDEIIGYWAAAAFLPKSPFILISALILFRLFDVSKFSLIARLEKLPGGIGIVADDIGAGIMANLILQVLVHYFA